jgi:hypothetical protein
MEKIRVINLKKKVRGEAPRCKIQLGNKELSDQVVEVSATVDAKCPNITMVTMKFITDDFEWKDGE